MTAPQALRQGLELVSFACLLALCALVLVASAQPLFTDDLWWHLALGNAYAAQGPWLAADPLLFTAAAPPAPVSWLADLALAELAAFGFGALRALHLALAAGLLFGVWRLARRAGASALLALAATALFAALAAYRLVQLRPHFATIGLALVLYRLLFEGRDPISGLRMAIAVAGMALWANLHGGFLLGPAMSFAAAAALGLGSLFASRDERASLRGRALRLAATGALGLLATGANPSGFAHHLAFFTAGAETPSLGIVLDEWAHLDPFSFPVADLPPSPLDWGLFWLLLLATPWAALRVLRPGRARALAETVPLTVLAFGALAAAIFAVRFAWMSVFPLLLVVLALTSYAPRARVRGLAAPLALLLLVGFVVFGSWPMVSQGLRLQGFWQAYRPAYPPGKYYAHATWFLADAKLEGRLFNEYVCGGFVGYWVAPTLRGFVNGTMNVPLAAMDALEAIREGRGDWNGEREGEAGAGAQGESPSLAELLDRYELDVFMGVGVPALPHGARPRWYSTALLEDLPGWIPVFRSQRAAVYLRIGPGERRRANLQRVVDYYAAAQVPFDPVTGFDPARAVEGAPQWAVLHGVVPPQFRSLQAAARGGGGPARTAAWQRLSLSYGVLGLYEQMLRIDRRALRESPHDAFARRRRVWALLHLGRLEEASREVPRLGPGEVEALLASVSAALERDPQDRLARSVIRRLPLLTHAEAAGWLTPSLQPAPRPPR